MPIDPPKPNREGEDDKLEFGFEELDEADETHESCLLDTSWDEDGDGEAYARRR